MRARKNSPGSARIDFPVKSRAESVPYPIRLPKAHLRVLKKHGVNLPEFVRQCISELCAKLS